MNLEILRHVPAGTEGHSRGTCESCGLHLWSEGDYRVPGLKGLFCSLPCIECGVAAKTGQKKRIADVPIGSGARLLLYLKSAAPEIYARLMQDGEGADAMAARQECQRKGGRPRKYRSERERRKAERSQAADRQRAFRDRLGVTENPIAAY